VLFSFMSPSYGNGSGSQELFTTII
jgi:hypothetical protein